MKISHLLTIVAAVVVLGAATQVQAGPHGHGGGGFSINAYVGHAFRGSGGHCQAPRKVRTCVIDRCSRRQVYYLPCGSRQVRYLTVVTYRDYYSNGRTRTYTRTHH